MSEKTASKTPTPVDVVNSSISGIQAAQANFTQLLGNKRYSSNIHECFQLAQRLLEGLYSLKFEMLSGGETADLSQAVSTPEKSTPSEQLTIPAAPASDCCKAKPATSAGDTPVPAKLNELIQRIRENDG